jgi:hypothetical protein
MLRSVGSLLSIIPLSCFFGRSENPSNNFSSFLSNELSYFITAGETVSDVGAGGASGFFIGAIRIERMGLSICEKLSIEKQSANTIQ